MAVGTFSNHRNDSSLNLAFLEGTDEELANLGQPVLTPMH